MSSSSFGDEANSGPEEEEEEDGDHEGVDQEGQPRIKKTEDYYTEGLIIERYIEWSVALANQTTIKLSTCTYQKMFKKIVYEGGILLVNLVLKVTNPDLLSLFAYSNTPGLIFFSTKLSTFTFQTEAKEATPQLPRGTPGGNPADPCPGNSSGDRSLAPYPISAAV